MPSHYEDIHDRQKTNPYLTIYQCADQPDTSETKFVQAGFHKAVSHFSDGSFNFGMGIILESAPDTFPKTNLRLKVECQRKGDSVHAKIGTEEVEFKWDGQKCPDILKMHECILSLLYEHLDHRMSDSAPQKMGFLSGIEVGNTSSR